MRYETRFVIALPALFFAVASFAVAQQPDSAQQIPVHLRVDAGVPLRLYITRRVPYRVGEVVQAQLIDPIWAFDRIVIPAGSKLQGEVVKLDSVPKIVRARAILGGDFTPLKHAEVSFMNLTLPDGHEIAIQTENSLGLLTIYMPPRPSKPAKKQKAPAAKPSAIRSFLRQQAQQQLQSQASARTGGLYDLVRGPNKKEWVENYVLSKLPYHPQWYRTRTRFDTVLTQPLDFGTVAIAGTELAKLGTPAPDDSVAQMRLLATVSSADAKVGDPIKGVLSQPVFAEKDRLLMPQGTSFTGRITLTQHAKLFHRGGKLRFTIDSVDLPEGAALSAYAERPRQTIQGQMVAVETNPNAVKVDSEGTATATESKTRLIRPAIAALVAAKSLDNDAGKQTASGGTSTETNYSGRALGGFSGFGLLGTFAARGPRPIGAALGFYGLAWSAYSNIVARGTEITFEKNTAVAIQFGYSRTK